MKAVYDQEAKKRPVNLTLNEDLVNRAREVTSNLSGVVETLLADYVAQAQVAQESRQRKIDTAMAAWNAFNDKHGSFADEHSTL